MFTIWFDFIILKIYLNFLFIKLNLTNEKQEILPPLWYFLWTNVFECSTFHVFLKLIKISVFLCYFSCVNLKRNEKNHHISHKYYYVSHVVLWCIEFFFFFCFVVVYWILSCHLSSKLNMSHVVPPCSFLNYWLREESLPINNAKLPRNYWTLL